jgi:hypothetical protein
VTVISSLKTQERGEPVIKNGSDDTPVLDNAEVLRRAILFVGAGLPRLYALSPRSPALAALLMIAAGYSGLTLILFLFFRAFYVPGL